MTATASPHKLDITLLTGTKLNVEVEIPAELTVLEGLEQPQAGNGTFRILHQEFGDKRVTWRRSVLQEINAAKDLFIELVKQGLTPFKVGIDGKQSAEVMREFDPHAEEVIFLPRKIVTGG